MKCRISLRQIEGFLLACEHPSFSSASAEMGITQSAFSQLIRELETQTGVRLFVRTTRRVSLTAAGEAMRLTMRRGMDAIDAAVDEAVAVDRGERGHVRVASVTSLALGILTRTLLRLRTEFPRITVSVREGDNDAMAELVSSGAVELALCAQLPTHTELAFDALFDDELMLVTSPTSTLAGKAVVPWEDLRGEPLVLTRRGTGTRDQLSAFLDRHGIVQLPDVEVATMLTAMSMVRAGFGSAFVSRAALQSFESHGLCVLQMSEPAVRRIGIYRRPDRPLSPAAKRLLDFFVEEMPRPRAVKRKGITS